MIKVHFRKSYDAKSVINIMNYVRAVVKILLVAFNPFPENDTTFQSCTALNSTGVV